MKPKLVLHICCAPDEAWVVKTLQDEYLLHCFFSNSNIHPPDEYEKRRDEAERVALGFDVGFTADEYEPLSWEDAVGMYAHTPEGGERCAHCFLLRLRRTARFCRDRGWERFTTVMSISPHKKIKTIDETGRLAAAEFGVSYEPFNFKKKDGFLNSIKLSRDLGLYRQDYCGCRLSMEERDARNRSG